MSQSRCYKKIVDWIFLAVNYYLNRRTVVQRLHVTVVLIKWTASNNSFVVVTFCQKQVFSFEFNVRLLVGNVFLLPKSCKKVKIVNWKKFNKKTQSSTGYQELQNPHIIRWFILISKAQVEVYHRLPKIRDSKVKILLVVVELYAHPTLQCTGLRSNVNYEEPLMYYKLIFFFEFAVLCDSYRILMMVN